MVALADVLAKGLDAMPALADARLASEVATPGLGVDERVARVGSDPVLAAAVMRAASPGPTTLTAAIWKLGDDGLARVAADLRTHAPATGLLAALDREHRQHARLAAVLARELAPRRGLVPEEAFLAGLLHEIGALFVIAALATEPVQRKHVYAAIVDEHHVDVGRLAATRWRLSAPLADAIMHHHAPQHCQRLHRPVVQLIAMVDEILAILARPDLGPAALVNVAGLDHDERFRVRATVEQQVSFDEAPIDDDVRWPVQRAARMRQLAYTTSHVSASALVLRGTQTMEVGWLTELVVEDTSPITLLVNIQACRAVNDGVEIVAQPFGLDGPTREAWMRLVRTARTPGGNA